jgi:cysteine synthase
MDEIKASILDTIGETPLIRLNRIGVPGVEILAKHEGLNPMGSVKERIALAMVEEAEREGRLTPDTIIVESSSGNTGIGLAMVAAVRGYRLLITMAKKVSVERRKILRGLGAELVLVDGGSDDAWDRADAIAASDPAKYCRIHQYTSRANARVHYERTGPEIWRQCGGRLDAFVVGLGTTGTIVGAGRFLKEKNPELRVVAVEPAPVNEQQGLRNVHVQRRPPIYDESVVDETVVTEDGPAFETALRLAREEGLFAGISSGSAVWAALQVAGRMGRGRIVVVLPDRGEKYLSTKLFDGHGDPAVEA